MTRYCTPTAVHLVLLARSFLSGTLRCGSCGLCGYVPHLIHRFLYLPAVNCRRACAHATYTHAHLPFCYTRYSSPVPSPCHHHLRSAADMMLTHFTGKHLSARYAGSPFHYYYIRYHRKTFWLVYAFNATFTAVRYLPSPRRAITAYYIAFLPLPFHTFPRFFTTFIRSHLRSLRFVLRSLPTYHYVTHAFPTTVPFLFGFFYMRFFVCHVIPVLDTITLPTRFGFMKREASARSGYSSSRACVLAVRTYVPTPRTPVRHMDSPVWIWFLHTPHLFSRLPVHIATTTSCVTMPAVLSRSPSGCAYLRLTRYLPIPVTVPSYVPAAAQYLPVLPDSLRSPPTLRFFICLFDYSFFVITLTCVPTFPATGSVVPFYRR